MPEKPVSYYYIEQYRDQKSLFTGVAAFQNGVPFNVTFHGDGNAKPERVFGQLVSADYFSVLGVQPQRGRVLSPGLDKPGDAPVVVISDRFWRNRLNSSSDAVGQTLRLNGQPATIVGITPKNFNGALSHESVRAVRSGHSAGGARSGARERRAASTRCQGVPGNDVPGAGRHH